MPCGLDILGEDPKPFPVVLASDSVDACPQRTLVLT